MQVCVLAHPAGCVLAKSQGLGLRGKESKISESQTCLELFLNLLGDGTTGPHALGFALAVVVHKNVKLFTLLPDFHAHLAGLRNAVQYVINHGCDINRVYNRMRF